MLYNHRMTGEIPKEDIGSIKNQYFGYIAEHYLKFLRK